MRVGGFRGLPFGFIGRWRGKESAPEEVGTLPTLVYLLFSYLLRASTGVGFHELRFGVMGGGRGGRPDLTDIRSPLHSFYLLYACTVSVGCHMDVAFSVEGWGAGGR